MVKGDLYQSPQFQVGDYVKAAASDVDAQTWYKIPGQLSHCGNVICTFLVMVGE